MQSSLIGKIEKSKRYAQERERVAFSELKVKFKGDSNDHSVEYKDNQWHCTCQFFHVHGLCSHTMAMGRILGEMLPAEARVSQLETTH